MTIHHGDCLEVMAGMDPESVDAIVTDPPYGLEFMGKEWDKLGPRGRHAGTERKGLIEEMGFKGFRDMPSFGSQTKNPKCETCGKYKWDHANRKCVCESPRFKNRHMGAEQQAFHFAWAEAAYRVAKPSAYLLAFGGTRTVHRMTVALEDAGWIIRDMLVWAYASGFPKSKASLKPAWEPIVMARKPGPLRMLAIDVCRIGVRDESKMYVQPRPTTDRQGASWSKGEHVPFHYGESGGRWPANVILTDPIFDGGVEGVVGGGEVGPSFRPGDRALRETHNAIYGQFPNREDGREQKGAGYGDSGTYSRFFLVPKASRSDREPVLTPDWFEGTGRVSTHPTVKPTDLMRHLVRLVTPTGGTVLDPFLGSGTTGLAAEMEGFEWIGIEREAEYVAIAEARLNGTQRGLGLEAS